MHTCLGVDEIVRLLVCEVVGSGWNTTGVSLACYCKSLGDPVLDLLWGTQDWLDLLLETFPTSIWNKGVQILVSLSMFIVSFPLNHLVGKVFKRTATSMEWAWFKKYAQRMRELKVKFSDEPIPSDILSVLQLRTLSEPLLPNLQLLELKEAPAEIVPFIPLFLSHRTVDVTIQFTTTPPAAVIASMIVNLPTLCPCMQSVCLQPLALEDSTITHAVSEMLLTCNLDTIQCFLVDSTLTEDGRRVVY